MYSCALRSHYATCIIYWSIILVSPYVIICVLCVMYSDYSHSWISPWRPKSAKHNRFRSLHLHWSCWVLASASKERCATKLELKLCCVSSCQAKPIEKHSKPGIQNLNSKPRLDTAWWVERLPPMLGNKYHLMGFYSTCHLCVNLEVGVGKAIL